jgi:hypothetical protein
MYNVFLVTHIVGLTIMAGTTFIDFITFNHFLKTYWKNEAQGLVIENLMNKLQRFMGIGMLVIILSGVGMMAYLHQVWGKQLWFQIKMGMLLLIIINGLGFRRILGSKLRKYLTENSSGGTEQLYKIKHRMMIVHILQMSFFVVIFFLSVFKFN